MTFSGNTLRRLRKAHGLTQHQLGELVGVHHSHISKWEKEDFTPDSDNIKKLARALGVPMSEFYEPAAYFGHIQPERTEQSSISYGEDKENRLYYLSTVRHYLHSQLHLVNEEISQLENPD